VPAKAERIAAAIAGANSCASRAPATSDEEDRPPSHGMMDYRRPCLFGVVRACSRFRGPCWRPGWERRDK
jgi:hypothetical protein